MHAFFLYVFSRDVNDTNFKIGVSYGFGGIWNRLTNFSICYPYEGEFRVQMMFITPTSTDARKLEILILKSKRLQKFPNSESSREWKIVSSRDTLKDVISKVIDSHPNLWTHAIAYGENGWKVIPNTGNAVRGLTAPSKRNTKQQSLEDAFK
jgi:hypothetical protein